MLGRTRRSRRTNSGPDISGMITSHNTASKRCGVARNVSSARRAPVQPTGSYPSDASTSSVSCTSAASSSTTRMH